ncbi:orotate phosphoribosyltransferase [Hyphococcus flavus]|uniref:Orotate phosphoribosyltransferase n=1 Tax=Hyphococcus flavus TaxID=1866326 RepID=A0AAE9ZAD1_9PROT|nr:orotate phosphoribosyltransferase [Hyphococcus flavus]WDI30529.1 orotate phosphoribosyltransferase [Hyphococcus flavus]
MSFDALKEFEEAGALQKGHFILSSGLHSDTYLNKSIVSMYPDRAERLCKVLAEKISAEISDIDYVISPAMGAIIYGYETARHLNTPFMFLERVDGEFQLRRGFGIEKGARIVVVEDIVSTGLSAREAISAVRKAGGEVLALGCLVDRSAGAVDVGAPILPLLEMKVEAWEPDDLPAHLKDVPAVKPGSRGVSQ